MDQALIPDNDVRYNTLATWKRDHVPVERYIPWYLRVFVRCYIV